MPALLVERDGAVLRLTLNRPEKRNALSPELLGALRSALAEAAADASVRCVVVTGAGRAFCAGGDFDAMLARRGDALATVRAQETQFAALARDILMLEKPVVAHVNGDAFGAGLMLALASDYAVCSPGARFAASFTKVGLVPDTGGSWLLPRLVGLREARALVMLAEPVDAARAVGLGLVNELHEDHAARADELARRLAAGATRALGLAKKALVLGSTDSLEGALAREAAFQGLCFTTRDQGEGVDSFLEKRAPAFEGR